MARSLGTFGTPHETGDDFDTFGWFGQDIRVVTAVNEVELVDLMEAAAGVDVEDLASMSVIKNMFRLVIPGEDFDTFWGLAKENRQTLEELSALFQALLTAITDRPTRQPSDSSDGRQSIGESSPPSSIATASSGRPDLQVIHDDYEATQQRLQQALSG